MAITPVQRLAAQRLGAGQTAIEVAEILRIPYSTVRAWVRNPDVAQAIQEAAIEHAQLVEAMLLAGEREAANTLLEALKAVNSKGDPDWKVRVAAALSLVDRAGARGKPVERTQLQAMVAGKADVQEALSKALKDPGVRAWIKSDPDYAKMLPAGEVHAAETVDAEII
jgi:CRP-like cAMP-binding protein